MLHQLLPLSRPLIVLDTETTGVNVESDRILELGFQVWTAEGMVKQWRSLINPGIPIPPEVTEIHHITDEMIRACQVCKQPRDGHDNENHPFKAAPFFRQIATSLTWGFQNCDYAGKNIRFDLRLTAFEMVRSNVSWSYVGARIIDIDRLEQIAVPRDLSSLHKKYTGLPHEDAHGALSDVIASVVVITKQLETHAEILPRDLDELHHLQWPGWLDSDGAFKLVNGVATCFFGKHKYKPMKLIPIDYYDWILKPSSNFPEDVKQLARAAKLGKFPGEG